MTSIDFYFTAGDRLGVACRLAGKAMRQNLRVMIYAPQPDLAQRIDRMLWTAPAVSFIPHCAVHDPLAASTPVLIAGEAPPPDLGCEVLLNLATDCPPFFERHERLLEVVAQDDQDRRAGRARYAFYRDRGYAIRNHDLLAAENRG
jgi:DNA polymerase-3 subunit chi